MTYLKGLNVVLICFFDTVAYVWGFKYVFLKTIQWSKFQWRNKPFGTLGWLYLFLWIEFEKIVEENSDFFEFRNLRLKYLCKSKTLYENNRMNFGKFIFSYIIEIDWNNLHNLSLFPGHNYAKTRALCLNAS